MATYLTRTPASTTDAQRKTWTYSVWIKPSNILSSGNGGEFAWIYQASGGSSAYVRMDSNYKIRYRDYTNGGSPDYLRITDRLFRDPSAWYHVVLRNDTTQSTAADRVRLYVNGELQEWQNANQPAQDHIGFINSTFPVQIGETSSNVLRGSYLSQAIMCAGQSYAPTVFGSTNANGIWVPNSSPSVTYGTNGFKLDFAGTGTAADASGFGADSSGNNNHFASTGLGTNPSTTDNPYNNFCTMSSIDTNTTASLSKGNTQLQRGSGYAGCNGTFGVANGKWYWEVKTPSPTTSGENSGFGVIKVPNSTQGQTYLGVNTNSWAIMIDNAASDIYKNHNNSFTDTGINASSNDIFQIALDMDNNKVYFGRNGTYFDSGNPSGNSNETYSGVSGDPFIFPAFSMNGNDTLQANFGNAPFSISSGNSDANGYGNFEYAVPSGYYALCTKNLAAYGG